MTEIERQRGVKEKSQEAGGERGPKKKKRNKEKENSTSTTSFLNEGKKERDL